ncbi:hypothetical protein TNCV_4520921 [Trichonephila clavipes]|nr:hypothetical protein TNCV_4520921 [Trichonephila clavipes]
MGFSVRNYISNSKKKKKSKFWRNSSPPTEPLVSKTLTPGRHKRKTSIVETAMGAPLECCPSSKPYPETSRRVGESFFFTKTNLGLTEDLDRCEEEIPFL